MRTIKNTIYRLSAAATLSLLFASCEITDVTDVEPVYQVSEDKVITNIEQAQTALYGVYGTLVSGAEYISYMPALTSMMGTTMQPGSFGGGAENAFFINEVTPDNYYLEFIYTKMYFLINNANHVISKTEMLNTNDPRKKEIIAEARFLRAQSHFYLLRLWGEFFDESSAYGIVIKKEPISNAAPQARATVAESYASIIEDLDYTIANAPAFTNTFYASNLAARALKSKVLLYKKDYAAAAALASEVIQSGERQLEEHFGDIFTKKIEDPYEVIFQTPFDDLNNRNNKAFMFRSYFGLSDDYVSLMETDARYEAAVAFTESGSARNNKFNNSVYNGTPLTADTEYFIRLDEIYLIYAEAVLRGNDNLNEAKEALNVIRERSKNPLNTITEKNELLEAIRAEKVLELGAESGEEWFDLVRYHKEGDIDINSFKELSSETRLILPFPVQTVELSEGIIKQNQGY
ncbi:RagB/SusD family nutrient uptake outer membrane protein [Sinomicrobium weinanense]|uniref:RagB/SusD family nutrient uptake outer membrane protein n=1 Tax=Sinomicrobium weinanense TaxID=2842200 RepID=A0A926JQF9_9FLAO|nr:RagB/SusD family nutrient uptake outer membrane protein [Sinomicrobium weinanense]MBC9795434.1 RagB/SusD family nutrient uptake outer membrane protein [Sinomicrobium weinanense]MBU3123959.1 RagB/SusD family nutrient uptake outer membrane protein [Sinomicrobium weinanense]